MYAINFLKRKMSFEDLASMAYADMARHTLRSNIALEDKKRKKEEVISLLKMAFLNVIKAKQKLLYDDWHRQVCDRIIKSYASLGIRLSYGQAQKWLNMLVKYIYVYNLDKFMGFFNYIVDIQNLHMPIDNKIIEIAQKKLSVRKPKSWSKMNYDEYMKYQAELNTALSNFSKDTDERIAFYWELINWGWI